MRRWAPGVVLAVVAGLLLLGAPSVADEAQHDDHGWWWRAQTGALDLPPPPFVPQDGLAVAQDVEGATAVSALRFEVDEGSTGATLILVEDVEQAGELAEIRACVAATSWSGAEAGVWDERPEADCEAGQATDLRDEGNGVWEFDVALLVEDGVLDVVLLPAADGEEPDAEGGPLTPGATTADEGGGAPFQVAFEAPDHESLELGAGFDGDFAADDFDEGAFEGDGSGDDEGPGDAGGGRAGPPTDVAESSELATPPSSSPDSGPPPQEPQASESPEVAAPDVAEESPEDDAVSLTPPDGQDTVGDDEVVAAPVGFGGDRARLLAGLMSLAAVVAAAVIVLGDRGVSVAGLPGLSSSRIVRPDVARSHVPELASGGQATGQGVVGGLGRFARPREGDPPSL